MFLGDFTEKNEIKAFFGDLKKEFLPNELYCLLV
jgi:hypothetical protein